MRKFKYLLLMLLIIVLNINVNASKCELSELSKLRTYAKEIEFTYDYKIENILDESGENEYKEGIFSVTAVNLNKDILVIYDVENFINYKYKTLKYNSSGTNTINNLGSGSKLTFELRAYTNDDCAGELLTTKIVSLPYFNHYINNQECKENPDFKYCVDLLDKKINDTLFYQELEKYKKDYEEPEDIKEELSNIYKYLKYIIIGIILIVIAILIIKHILKNKKKEEL